MFLKGRTQCTLLLSKYNKTARIKVKRKDKASVLKCICERESDRMGMRRRTDTGRMCAGYKLWAMKDAHWGIWCEHLTERTVSVTGSKTKQRTLQSWLWHASLRACASHPLSRLANQWAYCCDVCGHRFMGVHVLQCLASSKTVTADYKRPLPHTLTLTPSPFILPSTAEPIC